MLSFRLSIGLLLCCCSLLAEEICLVSYNVENLFRPGVARGYGVRQYRQKLHHIAKVIVTINGLDGPALVGLCEVENDSVLIDLCRQFPDRRYGYIHYDSPDARGIDVAMLYDRKRVEVLSSRPIRVELDSTTTTRDLLYVCARIDKDTIHVIQCHLPSQLGGAAASQWKRDKAWRTIDSVLDSIGDKPWVVMGDMNEDVKRCARPCVACETSNREVRGTHKWHGVWSMLDGAFVSPRLQEKTTMGIYDTSFLLEEDTKFGGVKPRRMNVFYGAKDGYSDHLPIFLRINLEN